MTWMVYAMGTAVALAIADVCVKLAAGKLSNSLALLIYASVSVISALIWIVWQRLHGDTLFAQPGGVAAAIGVGVAFGLVTIGLYATFGAGAPVSLGSPVIRLGGLLLASALGIVLLREPLSLRYMLGVLLACAGIYLIVTR